MKRPRWPSGRLVATHTGAPCFNSTSRQSKEITIELGAVLCCAFILSYKRHAK